MQCFFSFCPDPLFTAIFRNPGFIALSFPNVVSFEMSLETASLSRENTQSNYHKQLSFARLFKASVWHMSGYEFSWQALGPDVFCGDNRPSLGPVIASRHAPTPVLSRYPAIGPKINTAAMYSCLCRHHGTKLAMLSREQLVHSMVRYQVTSG
jgi:hypothetical protein